MATSNRQLTAEAHRLRGHHQILHQEIRFELRAHLSERSERELDILIEG